MDGLSIRAYGTDAGRRWDQVVSRLHMTDAAHDMLDADNAPVEQQTAMLDLSYQVRSVMWFTPAPDLTALAWKLRQAIVYEGVEDETSHPLNCVLRDVMALGAH